MAKSKRITVIEIKKSSPRKRKNSTTKKGRVFLRDKEGRKAETSDQANWGRKKKRRQGQKKLRRAGSERGRGAFRLRKKENAPREGENTPPKDRSHRGRRKRILERTGIGIGERGEKGERQ